MFSFHFLFFTSLGTRQVLYNLERKIRFNYKRLRSWSSLQYPNRKVPPSQLKDFPDEMYFLNNVDIYPKHFTSTGVKHFSMGKWLKWTTKTMHKKCTKGVQKSAQKFFYCTDIYICDNFNFLFHFFAIWLSVKFKDFFIIKTLFQILYGFVLLCKDKLKVQHESATCLLCTNTLHFKVALFLGGS